MTTPPSNPWFKFYPSDWRSDPGLSMCGAAARGVWMELICLMVEGPVYGDLRLANGKQPTMPQLAMLTRLDQDTLNAALAELEENGVFSRRGDGTIYSRRMERDAKKMAHGKEAAERRWGTKEDKPKGGGNGSPNAKPNGSPNGSPMPQKPEARVQSPSTSSSSPNGRAHARDDEAAAAAVVEIMPRIDDPPDRWMHLAEKREVDKEGVARPVVGGWYLDVAAKMVCDAAGIDEARWRGDWRPLIAWLKAGADLNAQIIPVIRARVGRRGYTPPQSLNYFSAEILALAKEAGAA